MRAICVSATEIVLCLTGILVSGQENTANVKLRLRDRVWNAPKIYSAIDTYFGHWQAVPNLDFDKEFQSF